LWWLRDAVQSFIRIWNISEPINVFGEKCYASLMITIPEHSGFQQMANELSLAGSFAHAAQDAKTIKSSTAVKDIWRKNLMVCCLAG
jgi:hypothetical protein